MMEESKMIKIKKEDYDILKEFYPLKTHSQKCGISVPTYHKIYDEKTNQLILEESLNSEMPGNNHDHEYYASELLYKLYDKADKHALKSLGKRQYNDLVNVKESIISDFLAGGLSVIQKLKFTY